MYEKYAEYLCKYILCVYFEKISFLVILINMYIRINSIIILAFLSFMRFWRNNWHNLKIGGSNEPPATSYAYITRLKWVNFVLISGVNDLGN